MIYTGSHQDENKDEGCVTSIFGLQHKNSKSRLEEGDGGVCVLDSLN